MKPQDFYIEFEDGGIYQIHECQIFFHPIQQLIGDVKYYAIKNSDRSPGIFNEKLIGVQNGLKSYTLFFKNKIEGDVERKFLKQSFNLNGVKFNLNFYDPKTLDCIADGYAY